MCVSLFPKWTICKKTQSTGFLLKAGNKIAVEEAMRKLLPVFRGKGKNKESVVSEGAMPV